MTIYFITEKFIKDETLIGKNVDINVVLPNIKSVALMYIKPLLGTYFFNDLLTKYNNQTLNSDEITLVSYIKDAIANKAAARSIISVNYQLKNKGLQVQSGDYSQNADDKVVMNVVSLYESDGDFYINQIEKYIIDNKDLFPNFTTDLNKDSKIKYDDGEGNYTKNIWFI